MTDRADSGSGGSRSDSKSKSSSIMDVPRRLRPQIVSVPIGCIAHCSDAGAEKFGLELVCKDARHLKFGVSDAIQSVLTAASKSAVDLHIRQVLTQICAEVKWRSAEKNFGFSMVDNALGAVRMKAVNDYKASTTSSKEQAEAAEAAVASQHNGNQASAAISVPHGAPHNFRTDFPFFFFLLLLLLFFFFFFFFFSKTLGVCAEVFLCRGLQ